MDELRIRVLRLSVMALPYLIALTLYAASKVYMAYWLGDKTQAASGRLTLNPLAHAHPIYTGLVPALALLAGFPLLLGFAKPVIYQTAFFRKIRRDLALMAIVGNVMNLLLAILSAALLSLAVHNGVDQSGWLATTLLYGVYLNCMFIVIHLLPVPPLDGGRLLEQLLPQEFSDSFRAIEPYSFLIMLGIIMLAGNQLLVPIKIMAGAILGLFM